MNARTVVAPLTFTLDLEDHRGDGSARYLANTATLLDFFASRGIRATVFVVGELVERAPQLIRRIHAERHELALHSWTHTPLTEEQPARFCAGLRNARDRLQDLIGSPVQGFRAPVFSLTGGSLWVVDVLAELGFRYSSSVLPGRHPLYGFPSASRQPFRWPGGVIEFPVPLLDLGPLALPLLGGIYLRYVPTILSTRWRASLAEEILPWSYIHPYDIDAGERYFRFPGTSAWMSVLLWRNRACTLARLAALHETAGKQSAPPFAEIVATGRYVDAPLFTGVVQT